MDEKYLFPVNEPFSKSLSTSKPYQSQSYTKPRTNNETCQNLHSRKSTSPKTSHHRKSLSPQTQQQRLGKSPKMSHARINKSPRRINRKSPENQYSFTSAKSPQKYNSRTKSPQHSSGEAPQVWRLNVDDKVLSKRYIF